MQGKQSSEDVENSGEGTHGHTDNDARSAAMAVISAIPLDQRYDVVLMRAIEDAGFHIVYEDHEAAVRADERASVAQLLDDNAATLAGFVDEGQKLLALVAYLLRLDGAS